MLLLRWIVTRRVFIYIYIYTLITIFIEEFKFTDDSFDVLAPSEIEKWENDPQNVCFKIIKLSGVEREECGLVGKVLFQDPKTNSIIHT